MAKKLKETELTNTEDTTEVNTEELQQKVTELYAQYNDLKLKSKALTKQTKELKNAIEETMTQFGVSELDIGVALFALMSKSKDTFNKKGFASRFEVDKKDVNEGLIAALVEEEETNSVEVKSFFETKRSTTFKIKPVKTKKV